MTGNNLKSNNYETIRQNLSDDAAVEKAHRRDYARA